MKGFRIIEVGPLARALTYTAYFGAVVLVLAAVNFGNLYLFAAAIAAAFFGIIGQRFTDMSKTLVEDKRSSSALLSKSVPFILMGLAVMGFLDAFVPRYFSVQLLGFQLYPALSGISVQSILQVGLVFTYVEAVMEEVLFRGGLMNAASKFTDEPLAAVVASAAGFGFCHVFSYGLSVVIVLMAAAGGLFAVFDLRTGDIATSMLFHVTNNVIAWAFTASVLGANPLMIVGVLTGHGLVVACVLQAKRGKLSLPRVGLPSLALILPRGSPL